MMGGCSPTSNGSLTTTPFTCSQDIARYSCGLPIQCRSISYCAYHPDVPSLTPIHSSLWLSGIHWTTFHYPTRHLMVVTIQGATLDMNLHFYTSAKQATCLLNIVQYPAIDVHLSWFRFSVKTIDLLNTERPSAVQQSIFNRDSIRLHSVTGQGYRLRGRGELSVRGQTNWWKIYPSR